LDDEDLEEDIAEKVEDHIQKDLKERSETDIKTA